MRTSGWDRAWSSRAKIEKRVQVTGRAQSIVSTSEVNVTKSTWDFCSIGVPEERTPCCAHSTEWQTVLIWRETTLAQTG